MLLSTCKLAGGESEHAGEVSVILKEESAEKKPKLRSGDASKYPDECRRRHHRPVAMLHYINFLELLCSIRAKMIKRGEQ